MLYQKVFRHILFREKLLYCFYDTLIGELDNGVHCDIQSTSKSLNTDGIQIENFQIQIYLHEEMCMGGVTCAPTVRMLHPIMLKYNLFL